ncbi:hypothetical protein, partial [Pseudomonas aeruginosa]|uniref:hypothetical protein n=1 Tax=Pseudomonas aeruginosa TaxID=287 RepID=UPI001C3163EA
MPLSASTSFKPFNPERSAAAKILLEDRQNEHTRPPKEKEGKRRKKKEKGDRFIPPTLVLASIYISHSHCIPLP